jgi:hypothetical protein
MVEKTSEFQSRHKNPELKNLLIFRVIQLLGFLASLFNGLVGPPEAYLADAIAALFGSMLGVSTVATFAESTAGVADGAKTGDVDLGNVVRAWK